MRLTLPKRELKISPRVSRACHLSMASYQVESMVQLRQAMKGEKTGKLNASVSSVEAASPLEISSLLETAVVLSQGDETCRNIGGCPTESEDLKYCRTVRVEVSGIATAISPVEGLAGLPLTAARAKHGSNRSGPPADQTNIFAAFSVLSIIDKEKYSFHQIRQGNDRSNRGTRSEGCNGPSCDPRRHPDE